MLIITGLKSLSRLYPAKICPHFYGNGKRRPVFRTLPYSSSTSMYIFFLYFYRKQLFHTSTRTWMEPSQLDLSVIGAIVLFTEIDAKLTRGPIVNLPVPNFKLLESHFNLENYQYWCWNKQLA